MEGRTWGQIEAERILAAKAKLEEVAANIGPTPKVSREEYVRTDEELRLTNSEEGAPATVEAVMRYAYEALEERRNEFEALGVDGWDQVDITLGGSLPIMAPDSNPTREMETMAVLLTPFGEFEITITIKGQPL